MKCERCPLEDECERTKQLAVEQYVTELREPIRRNLEGVCPLVLRIELYKPINEVAGRVAGILTDYKRITRE